MLTLGILLLLISGNYGVPLVNNSNVQTILLERNANSPSFTYAALGDGYSAGPGAGEAYDKTNATIDSCFRTIGSYPAILNDSLKTSFFQFLSCAAETTTKDLITSQSAQLSWSTDKTYLTISVGADDIFFTRIILWCLVVPPSLDLDGNCKTWTEKAWDLLRGPDTNDTIYQSLSAVWTSLGESDNNDITPGLKRFVPTVHSLYPRLFNAENKESSGRSCNNVSIVQSGPKLTQELRASINNITDALNQKIVDSLVRFKEQKDNAGSIGQISISDPNAAFEGHRICEQGVPGFDDPNVWFFGPPGSPAPISGETVPSIIRDLDPQTCDENGTDVSEVLGCAYAKADALGKLSDDIKGVWNDTVDSNNSDLGLRFLHPKAAGHQQTAAQLLKIFNLRTATSQIVKRKYPIRVLPLGDSITNGYLSTDKNGYRKVFYDGAAEGGPINMVGSRKGEGNMTDNDEEGWNGYTIDLISYKASFGLNMTPTVILLHAGTNDMDTDEHAEKAPASMAALIDKCLTIRPDAALLVSTIIPAWDPARQARYDKFNLAVQDMVQTRRDSGKKVMQMFMDKVVPPDMLIDGIHPTDQGYHDMGLHWLQGLDEAEELGWLVKPDQPHRLTKGDIIAICVVVGVVVITALLVVIWFIRKKANKHRRLGENKSIIDSQTTEEDLVT